MQSDQLSVTKLRLQRDPSTPANFTPDEQECLQSLHFMEMHWRRNDVADPAPETCAWLLEHESFCKWLRQEHGLLWIKGKPGAGKSTVLKHALETLARGNKQDFILASFFFHGRGASIQKSVLGLFRSLLHQILQQNRDLLSILTSQYTRNCETFGKCEEKWNWHENELRSFFKSHVVDAAETQQIRIFIDALDECGEDIATELIEFFRLFTAPIPICFSCRHYPLVALEGGIEVCVEKENEQDIKSYVHDKIKAHIQRTDTADALRYEIVARSRGNFQWVILVTPRVLKLYKSRNSLVTLQSMIRKLPAKLNELCTQLLADISSDSERLQSLRLMQWIAFAFRPLTLTELRVAGIGSEKAFYVMATYFRGNRISKGLDPCTSQEC